MKKIKVLRDKREKIPWNFDFYDDVIVENYSLKTGDYTIEGLEDKFCIERKGSTGEIALNIGKKKDAFNREMERLESFKYKYIICEFDKHVILDFPKNSGIPASSQKYIRIHKNYIISFLDNITIKHNIPIIYCSDQYAAQETAYNLFLEVLEKEYGQK